MVSNPYRVGKTQWAKWNDEGRVAFNESMDAGSSVVSAIEMANAVTKDSEEGLRAKKRNIFDIISDVVETATDVAAVATPVVAVAKAMRGKKKAK